MPGLPVLVLNSGSSSIKFSMYESGESARRKLMEGAVDGIGSGEKEGKFWIKDPNDRKIVDQSSHVPDLASAFKLVEDALLSAEKHSGGEQTWPHPAAIGHRVVCGGPTITENQRVSPELIEELERYVHFAPLHNPVALFIIRETLKLFPEVPNFICLDSYFHRNLPEVTRRLPVPAKYTEMGVQRFGAHGISYESIIEQLKPSVPSRLIVAHLGNGASIAAIRDGQSIDTSMGLTPTGGIISGTRTGDIDPGVLLFILRELLKASDDGKHAADELEDAVSKQAGLLGVSKTTNDMRDLRKAIVAGNADARLAVDQFTYTIRKFIGAYIAVLGGLDMLVFTGGIGVNDSDSRAEICSGLECFGIVLDAQRNSARGDVTISPDDSSVTVRVIPPEEDLIMVNHVYRLMAESSH
ncbi:acetate/propionate family kinase [Acidicapsa dinghuensis]|uniref:Acetate kinase n=1 Tax=Acidicapsa dinghuensis TaxID=2218256 RepID=A0ABW1EDH6_9BACT|nr:acetate/propionate family kinase [Acidicapsa dinghuensis]